MSYGTLSRLTIICDRCGKEYAGPDDAGWTYTEGADDQSQDAGWQHAGYCIHYCPDCRQPACAYCGTVRPHPEILPGWHLADGDWYCPVCWPHAIDNARRLWEYRNQRDQRRNGRI
ncbi:hypothetical protein CSQ85_09295 [Bifidobacterium rousetti]|uniref:hypothetical protein n=1 Tax=Bifidobacterium rousetti TaxID=2045439 RepID=UPI0012384D90|nr:hypothetical protein [Bifidobacterium rousetti]KAA8818346.1 hypothetical protein CSQ85_09295 [Bifidobacterium rousetti]